jgi:hypothetical protein
MEHLDTVCHTGKEVKGATDRIGGAQLATMTLFAPTSLAIWTISLDVVPRTIESSTMRTFLSTNSRAIAFSFRRTFFFLFRA